MNAGLVQFAPPLGGVLFAGQGRAPANLSVVCYSFHVATRKQGPFMSTTSQPASPPSATRLELPVTVLVECRQARSGRWLEEQWEAVAVMAGEDVLNDASSTTLVHEDAECRRYLWSGLKLKLYKDACESYWYNLMSGKPYLYVICYMNESEDGVETLSPVLVSADQQEASGHMETDDRVFSVPMPEQVYLKVERFVVEHYVPEQKKKRKRTQWAKESEHVEAAEHNGTRPVRH
jgi:hypothetical protein